MMPRPKGYSQSPESRARQSARMKAWWSSPAAAEYRARVAANLDGWKDEHRRPAPGSKDHKTFAKISRTLGAAAAHAELRRGA